MLFLIRAELTAVHSSVLQQELDSCRLLLEEEPDNKCEYNTEQTLNAPFSDSVIHESPCHKYLFLCNWANENRTSLLARILVCILSIFDKVTCRQHLSLQVPVCLSLSVCLSACLLVCLSAFLPA